MIAATFPPFLLTDIYVYIHTYIQTQSLNHVHHPSIIDSWRYGKRGKKLAVLRSVELARQHSRHRVASSFLSLSTRYEAAVVQVETREYLTRIP